MKDLTVSQVQRQNILNNKFALEEVEKNIGIQTIYFEDDMSKKMVETTIWGVTEERVILKQGVVIPVKRIHKIV